MHTIVVGVDGSEASLKALRFALEEARIRGGGEVKAVNAWHVPTAVYEAGVGGEAVDPTEFRRDAESSLRSSLEHAGAPEAGVEVTPIVREGQAADILVELARDANLVVVGSRGRGGFRGLLLGSVSQQVAQHAPCPVVIIPHGEEDPKGGES